MVEKISWNDAVEFCEALTKKERVPNTWKFTLPSDAQWEYACRAGTTTIYSWGENVDARYINEKPLSRQSLVVLIFPILGAFLICMGMSENGVMIISPLQSRNTNRSY